MKKKLVMMSILLPSVVGAQTLEERVQSMETLLKQQTELIQKQQQTINELKSEKVTKKDEPQTPEKKDDDKKLLEKLAEKTPAITVTLDTSAYMSNLKTTTLENIGMKGFNKYGSEYSNGFNFKEATIKLFSPLGSMFEATAVASLKSTEASIDEAFITAALPYDFKIKAGRFKSDAGRLNNNDYEFVDIALPYRAFLGPKGIDPDNGIQVSKLFKIGKDKEIVLGAEALQGSNELLFGEDKNKGPHLFTTYLRATLPTSENSKITFGPWAMFGATSTDKIMNEANKNQFTGNSQLYGMEAFWKYEKDKHEVTLQGEYLYLKQYGTNNEFDDAGNLLSINSLDRNQDGAYIQAHYRYDKWRFGLRYDKMGIFTDKFEVAKTNVSYPGRPWRTTAAIEYSPVKYAKLRAQFTHDESSRQYINNEAMLQAVFTFGSGE